MSNHNVIEREFLTYADLEAWTGIPVGTWYSWVHQRRVPFHRFSSRKVLFRRSEMQAWFDQHYVPVGE